MHHFLNGSEADYAALERKARAAAFVNFPGVELPSAFAPTRARIGLQIDRMTGGVTFFIERGVRYYGANPSIRQWVQDGQAAFADLPAFRRWLATQWKNEFDPQPFSIDPKATHNQSELPLSTTASKETPLVAETRSAQGAGPDAIVTPLVTFLIQHTAKNYGVEVCHIDGGVLEELQRKLRDSNKEIACHVVADDLLGGPFALASVEGHRVVAVHAGPPIACTPEP